MKKPPLCHIFFYESTLHKFNWELTGKRFSSLFSCTTNRCRGKSGFHRSMNQRQRTRFPSNLLCTPVKPRRQLSIRRTRRPWRFFKLNPINSVSTVSTVAIPATHQNDIPSLLSFPSSITALSTLCQDYRITWEVKISNQNTIRC